MNIALTAHDAKKELMVQFCIAYCGILSRHNLCATGTTGKLVEEATGLSVHRFLSGPQGGDQQIAARISCNEIDLLLYFRDPMQKQALEPHDKNLLRLCDLRSRDLPSRHGSGLRHRFGSHRRSGQREIIFRQL